jgi:alanine dehydrogenase
MALTNATLPYAVTIASKGWKAAALSNPSIKAGINIADGLVTYCGVAEAFGLKCTPVDEVLKGEAVLV